LIKPDVPLTRERSGIVGREPVATAKRRSIASPAVRNSCCTMRIAVRRPVERMILPYTISCRGATLWSITGQLINSSTLRPGGKGRPASKRIPPLDTSTVRPNQLPAQVQFKLIALVPAPITGDRVELLNGLIPIHCSTRRSLSRWIRLAQSLLCRPAVVLHSHVSTSRVTAVLRTLPLNAAASICWPKPLLSSKKVQEQ
jgi:hypothetical protein